MRLNNVAMAVVVAAVVATGTAHAGSIVYNLNSTAVGQFGAGPYGTVTLTTNGAHVDFVVDLAASLKLVNTGNTKSHSLFALNGTGVAAADIKNITNNTTATFLAYTLAVAQPFGGFALGIKCVSCGQGGQGATPGPLTFTVENAVLADFAVKSDKKKNGAYFSADVMTTKGKTGQLGATGAGAPIAIPDSGASLILLGGSLTVLGLVRRLM